MKVPQGTLDIRAGNTDRAEAGSADSLVLGQEHFRLMVEAVKDYAIFMLDPSGRVVSWNEGAKRIKGYEEEEIVGRHFSIFYPPEALATGWPNRELEIARTEGRLEDEGWRVRKDGSRFWSNVVITALRDRTGDFVGFTKVTRDMTDVRRIESLELAERRMSEFLAMLSHELRNPLAPIRNAVSTMYLKKIDDPDVAFARDVVDRQVKHLTRLVDDLLDINRITTGTIRLQRAPVLLSSVIDRAVEACRPVLTTRGHHLELILTVEPMIVMGDEVRLAQVLINLLNNAAKYTPEGGRIWLSLVNEDNRATIRIRDNGVGIAPDQLKTVFDLFKQGNRTLDRSEGGLGIGLTLVRELVGRHGGSVSASSEGIGHGTEFVVRFPLVRGSSLAPASRPEPATAQRTDVARPRIMVVDDHPDIVESMSMLLELWGFPVDSANDGPTALELAATYRPDIVLLDIGLPKMDGYTVARQLLDLPNMPDMKLVALTGYGQTEDKERSRAAGIHHHLVKPADPDQLLELLEKLSAAMNPTAA